MTQIKSTNNAFFGHPKPLGSLFFTEMWERFSFYGIRPLLILFMAATLSENGLGIDRPTASAIVGIFGGSIYLAALPGGWIADNWLGQERSVWYGAIITAFGHLSIALSAWFGTIFFFFGLMLIVVGIGLFKTCISVIVGMLYKDSDTRRDSGFSIFYMGINLGAFIAPIIGGLLHKTYGWHAGFGVGGVGMLVALVIFRLIAMPNMEKFAQEEGIERSWGTPTTQRTNVGYWITGIAAVILLIFFGINLDIIPFDPNVMVNYTTIVILITIIGYFFYLFFFAGLNKQERIQLVFCFILFIASAFFWSAFEQKPTSMNLFVEDYTYRVLFGFEIPTIWFQSINAIFIIILAPIFALIWPLMHKYNMEPSSIIKFAFGLFFAALAFSLLYMASSIIIRSDVLIQVSPFWIIGCIFFLTVGELCLSPVGLSIMTQLAPKVIRGQIMGLWFASIALGNLVASKVGGKVKADTIGDLPHIFMMVITALVIVGVALLVINRIMRYYRHINS